MESIAKISTQNMSGTEWRQARKASIGGSDAAAILRLSDYSSPYTVWAEKTGRIPEKEDNEAMRQGRDLEQYVADRFCEQTGKKVRRVNAIIKNDRYPFAHANIDRAVIGEHAGLECKTTSVLNLRKFANGEYPANYYVQCVHYMAVTGAEKWYLAVLVLGRDFLVYEIPRDDDEIAALMQSESEFWELVKCNTPPAADGSKSTTDTINQMYSGVSDSSIELFGVDQLVESYIDAKSRKKLIEAEIAEHENQLKSLLGDYETGMTGIAKVTWKEQFRNTFDEKLFHEQFPQIDLSKFKKTTRTRVFKVSKFKEVI